MLAQRQAKPEGMPWSVVSGVATPFFAPIDPNGNMTADGQKTYEWDAENRLVAVKEGATSIASYTYNSSGIRTSRTTSGLTTTYALAGRSIVEERVGAVANRQYQGPGIDNVLAMQNGAGAVTYLTRDHLGSVREQVNASGTVTLRRGYDAWGNATAGADAGGWAFTGREDEIETGLQYYRARYYDPRGGRFISEDPIGLLGGNNFYGYVGGNPVHYGDPFGLLDPGTIGRTIGSYVAPVVPIAAGAAVVDGPLPIGDAVALVLVAGAVAVGVTVAVVVEIMDPVEPGPIPIPVPGPGPGPGPGPKPKEGCDKKCPPCPPARPPVVHTTHPHWPCPGAHRHYFEMNQRPWPDCTCFGKKSDKVDCL